MRGNARHGHIVPFGQRDAKEGSSLLRIGFKHLVEIPQPEKQQSILLEAFPCLAVLLHHWGFSAHLEKHNRQARADDLVKAKRLTLRLGLKVRPYPKFEEVLKRSLKGFIGGKPHQAVSTISGEIIYE